MPRYCFEDFVNVGSPIGNGSYGQVWKVLHKKTNEHFAMKVINKKKVLEHQMTAYLMREVKTQLRLRHPNILRLHYYFEDAEKVYLLLEFVAGGTLFSLLRKRGHLPESEAAVVFTDVAKALVYLHKHGIVHRDLKPENLLMSGSVTKVADFGWCANMLKNGGQRTTFCGTWDYLSPEMIQNEPHDFTVDIWASGVLLFELLTGRAPFADKNQMKALSRITTVDLHIPEAISPPARSLIEKLLVKEPQLRLSLEEALRHTWIQQHNPICAAEAEVSASRQWPPPTANGTSPTRYEKQLIVAQPLDPSDLSSTSRPDAMTRLREIQAQLSKPRPAARSADEDT